MWTITMWAWVTRFNATFLRVEQLPEAVFAITGEATEMGYHPSEFQWECEESDFLDSLLDVSHSFLAKFLEVLCIGCDVCRQVCPTGAITPPAESVREGLNNE